MTATKSADTTKLVVATAVMAFGALTLGAPVALADDAVVDQASIVEQQPTTAGDQGTTERRKGRVYIIGKTTKPHARQG
ncbi:MULTISPECIES: 50S ribosomal protein L36 [unclassified Mycobacterium]|uniref:50S ribosomal protein L36 n=1 Tax=unclassified Mycobacterium TaxID=2642494 RepID=UPI0029C8CE79|nr:MULTISPECIES: 50S ribosomal protein L36 [unclassified Mycobacterium]